MPLKYKEDQLMILLHIPKVLSDKLAMVVGMNGAASSHLLVKMEELVYIRRTNTFDTSVLVLVLVRPLNVVLANM